MLAIQQIRDALATRLNSVATVCFRGRALEDSQLPALRIKTVGDDSPVRGGRSSGDGEALMARCTAQFEVVAIVATTGDVEAAAFAVMLDAKRALLTDRTLGGIARDVRSAGMGMQDDFEGEIPVLACTTKLEVDYLIDESAPDQVIGAY